MAKHDKDGTETADENLEPGSLTSHFRRRRERVVDGRVIEPRGRNTSTTGEVGGAI